MMTDDPPEIRLPTIEVASPPASPLAARLLKIAEGYRRERSFHSAIEIYLELVERDPHSTEGLAARDALVLIGEDYERNGELRQARSLYERLF